MLLYINADESGLKSQRHKTNKYEDVVFHWTHLYLPHCTSCLFLNNNHKALKLLYKQGWKLVVKSLDWHPALKQPKRHWSRLQRCSSAAWEEQASYQLPQCSPGKLSRLSPQYSVADCVSLKQHSLPSVARHMLAHVPSTAWSVAGFITQNSGS